ncbi:hypothetical protein Y1Q_0019444 [Alligator mississippiensis]|uniref:Uncharacterized protein n=1 Tax=Alligator mississippiensis TaxID=8496 RepID=A0A151NMK1_ALLMI|nr:hypothetical protein Y1Q_0019444 [Alligator mississippiensis]
MDAAHPARKDASEVALVVNHALQDNGEVALVVDESLGTLGWAVDKDMGAIHSPDAVGKAHVVEVGDHFLQVYEADEVIGQDILDDQTHIPDGFSSFGLGHAELVGDIVEFHFGDDHLLLWNESLHADILVHDVGGHLGNNVHEVDPVHMEDLDPQFIVPGVLDNLLPTVAAHGTGPEPLFNGLKVVPEHPSIHSTLGGLVLISYVEVGEPIQHT